MAQSEGWTLLEVLLDQGSLTSTRLAFLDKRRRHEAGEAGPPVPAEPPAGGADVEMAD